MIQANSHSGLVRRALLINVLLDQETRAFWFVRVEGEGKRWTPPPPAQPRPPLDHQQPQVGNPALFAAERCRVRRG